MIIRDILSGKEDNVNQPLTPSKIAHFKYPPITTRDVERSCSVYKNLLAYNRRSFIFENLCEKFFIRCNAQ